MRSCFASKSAAIVVTMCALGVASLAVAGAGATDKIVGDWAGHVDCTDTTSANGHPVGSEQQSQPVACAFLANGYMELNTYAGTWSKKNHRYRANVSESTTLAARGLYHDPKAKCVVKLKKMVIAGTELSGDYRQKIAYHDGGTKWRTDVRGVLVADAQ